MRRGNKAGFRERALAHTLSRVCRLPAPFLCLLLFSSCGSLNRGDVRPHVEEPFPRTLSQWRLFVGQPSNLQPNKGVIPYDLNTQLFTDYAAKHRFVWMPPGTSALYRETETFEFPVGTIFSKTFAYPIRGQAGKERLIETRLLVHAKSGWVGLPYVWNDGQTDATLQVAADPTPVHWTHPSGENYAIEYIIPNANQCKSCHENAKVMSPLGPKARNLNKDFDYPEGRANQLGYWTKIGYLRGAPPPEKASRQVVWDDPVTGSVEARARAYLDVQCAHCHNPNGPARTSGLYLNASMTDPLRLGVCKVPVSAGQGSGDLRFDIVPGKPQESIFVYRMNSSTPKIMMPELGRTVVHKEAVALMREWITSMRGDCGT